MRRETQTDLCEWDPKRNGPARGRPHREGGCADEVQSFSR